MTNKSVEIIYFYHRNVWIQVNTETTVIKLSAAPTFTIESLNKQSNTHRSNSTKDVDPSRFNAGPASQKMGQHYHDY